MKKKVFILCAVLPVFSYASLGSNVNSINLEAKQQGVLSKNTLTSDPRVMVYKLNKNGLSINQYAYNNIVFAVNWSGNISANLNVVLGNYANQIATEKAKIYTLHQRIVDTNDIFFNSYGVPGVYFGNTYLKKLVPENFNMNLLNTK